MSIRTVAVEKLKIGDVTVDGVVFDVSQIDGIVRVEHRHTIYLEPVGAQLQVFTRVPREMVDRLRSQ